MNGDWWKVYTRWRSRNFCGVGITDGWFYRIEYHDGSYWRTVYPYTLRFVNKDAADQEIISMGFSPEEYEEGVSKRTVKWW